MTANKEKVYHPLEIPISYLSVHCYWKDRRRIVFPLILSIMVPRPPLSLFFTTFGVEKAFAKPCWALNAKSSFYWWAQNSSWLHRWTVSNIKSVPFGHKWTISVPGITINSPVATLMRTSINLVTKQIYNPGIVKCNPWSTYSPLVPK